MNFKINNREWTIAEKSQKDIKNMQNIRNANKQENLESINTRYYGITYTDIQKIYIDEALPQDRKKATFCYINSYITHLEKRYTEEDVADIVSNSYDIIHGIVDKYFEIEINVEENIMEEKP